MDRWTILKKHCENQLAIQKELKSGGINSDYNQGLMDVLASILEMMNDLEEHDKRELTREKIQNEIWAGEHDDREEE